VPTGGNGNYHIVASADGGNDGAFRGIDIENYLGNFEDMGYLVGDNDLQSDAYRSFSYDIEKAWCNVDVQRVIRQARQADKSVTAFEKLALPPRRATVRRQGPCPYAVV
jgi:hypothetical protein